MTTVDNILSTFVKKESNRHSLKRYLDSITKKENEQKFILYEVLSHNGISDVLQMLREKQFMFHHNDFKDIETLVQEQEAFLHNPVQVEDGVIECHRCKSHKTFSYAKQTRASDEGTTVFVTCSECKFQFRL